MKLKVVLLISLSYASFTFSQISFNDTVGDEVLTKRWVRSRLISHCVPFEVSNGTWSIAYFKSYRRISGYVPDTGNIVINGDHIRFWVNGILVNGTITNENLIPEDEFVLNLKLVPTDFYEYLYPDATMLVYKYSHNFMVFDLMLVNKRGTKLVRSGRVVAVRK